MESLYRTLICARLQMHGLKMLSSHGDVGFVGLLEMEPTFFPFFRHLPIDALIDVVIYIGLMRTGICITLERERRKENELDELAHVYLD